VNIVALAKFILFATIHKSSSDNKYMEKQKRRIYWLRIKMHSLHESKQRFLLSQGLEVQFLDTMEELASKLKERRVGTLVVEDDFLAQSGSSDLISMPELQGVCFLLSFSHPRIQLLKEAATSAFRDIIPIHLDDSEWLKRFYFATSRRAQPFREPAEFFHSTIACPLLVPGRLVEVTAQGLIIESRIRPQNGDHLSFEGELADALGLRRLQFEVVSTSQNNLRYRFSRAILARVDAQILSRMMQALATEPKHEAPRRIFLAVQDVSLRRAVQRICDPLRYDVSVALNRASITQEPAYSSPECIIIDQGIITQYGEELIVELKSNIAEQTRVVYLGEWNDEWPRFANQFDYLNLPQTFQTELSQTILPVNPLFDHWSTEGSVFISPKSSFSAVEIVVPNVLTGLHPTFLLGRPEIPIDDFTLCRLESDRVVDILAGSRYIKTVPMRGFGGYICDRRPVDAKEVADNIVQYANKCFKGLSIDIPITPPTQKEFVSEVSRIERRILSGSEVFANALRKIGMANVAKFLLICAGLVLGMGALSYYFESMDYDKKMRNRVFTDSLRRAYEKAHGKDTALPKEEGSESESGP
jgi:hypothetical protein